MTPTELTFINWHSIICALQWLTDKSMVLKINQLVSTQRGIHTLYCGAFFLGVIYLTYSSSFPLEHRAFWGWQLPTVFCISFISLRATIKDTLVVKKVMFRPKHCKSDLSLWFTTLSGMTSIPAVLKWRSPLGRFLHNLIPIQLVMWWGMSSGLYIVCIPMLQPENFTWGLKWPLKTIFKGSIR